MHGMLASGVLLLAGVGQSFQVPLPTLGGKQFWSDVMIHHDWRIQRYLLTDRYRLLDDHNVNRRSGDYDTCWQRFQQLARQKQLPPLGAEVVITLHGLGRTRQAMQQLGRHLAADPDLTWLNMSYASTRASIDDHAEHLRLVTERLAGVRRVHFAAHSLGNLVVRRYLHERQLRGAPAAPAIGRVVMLAPPNNGAALARRFKDSNVFKLILGDSGQQLANGWADVEQRLQFRDVEFGILAGRGPAAKLNNPLIAGADDLVVLVEETRLVGARDFQVLPVGHTVIMDHDLTKEYTLRFLREGFFIDRGRRAPIER